MDFTINLKEFGKVAVLIEVKYYCQNIEIVLEKDTFPEGNICSVAAAGICRIQKSGRILEPKLQAGRRCNFLRT
jgi:hypothetical protein